MYSFKHLLNFYFMPEPVLSAAKVNKTQSGGEDVYVNDDTASWKFLKTVLWFMITSYIH